MIDQRRSAAPRIPTTAPNVSRRGTCVGAAPPADWGGASGTPELLVADVGVAGAEEKSEEAGLAVPFIEVSEVVGVGVLGPLVDELEEVGSST